MVGKQRRGEGMSLEVGNNLKGAIHIPSLVIPVSNEMIGHSHVGQIYIANQTSESLPLLSAVSISIQLTDACCMLLLKHAIPASRLARRDLRSLAKQPRSCRRTLSDFTCGHSFPQGQ